jgi:hypothetical protein
VTTVENRVININIYLKVNFEYARASR